MAGGLDLERVFRGDYDPVFLAWVVAWWQRHRLVEMHKNAEVERAMNRRRR